MNLKENVCLTGQSFQERNPRVNVGFTLSKLKHSW